MSIIRFQRAPHVSFNQETKILRCDRCPCEEPLEVGHEQTTMPDRIYMTQDMFDDILSWGRESLQCEHCGRSGIEGIHLEDARTCYAHEAPTFWQRIQAENGGLTPTPVHDPNRPVALCRRCAKEHHDFWDAQWDEYYSGLL